jgi:hypothetical protein
MDAERQRQIVQQWQRYKPLTPDTIRRERLAYGKLTLKINICLAAWISGKP